MVIFLVSVLTFLILAGAYLGLTSWADKSSYQWLKKNLSEIQNELRPLGYALAAYEEFRGEPYEHRFYIYKTADYKNGLTDGQIKARGKEPRHVYAYLKKLEEGTISIEDVYNKFKHEDDSTYKFKIKREEEEDTRQKELDEVLSQDEVGQK